jgi:hypothetical protein
MHRLAALALTIGCSKSPAQIVFVCEHGAAKSVIAASQLQRLASERGLTVRAIARGAEPQATPSTRTADGLRLDGLPPPTAPRPLNAADVRDAIDIVLFDCDASAMRPLRGLGRCWDDVPPISAGYETVRDSIRAHLTGYLGEAPVTVP